MNLQIFSIAGYAGVVLLALLPLAWLFCWFKRPKFWLAHALVLLALVAFILAKVNSSTHVNRLQIDPSKKNAIIATALEIERKRKEEERSGDVANIRFAEDSRGDYLDKAGMDEGDKAYFESSKVDNAEPTWKQNKVSRQTTQDQSLTNAIGGGQESEGVEFKKDEEPQAKPIILPGEDVDMAHRLDSLNLLLSKCFLLFAVLFVILDYLRRFHVYREAYWPLPLPSNLNTALSTPPVVLEVNSPARREPHEELAHLSKQGASFIYLGDSPDVQQVLEGNLYRYPFNKGEVEVLPVDFEGEAFSPDFMFESLWFGRSSFVDNDLDRAHHVLGVFSKLLLARQKKGAKCRQRVVLVWAFAAPIPQVFIDNINILGPRTGFSIFLCSASST